MNNLEKYIQVSEDFGNLNLSDGDMIAFIIQYEPSLRMVQEEHIKFYINFLNQMPKDILYLSCKNIVIKCLNEITLLNAMDSKKIEQKK